jgi:hypothetical protein
MNLKQAIFSVIAKNKEAGFPVENKASRLVHWWSDALAHCPMVTWNESISLSREFIIVSW